MKKVVLCAVAIAFAAALNVIGDDAVGADSIEMVFVQGGTFAMGCALEGEKDCAKDEKPVRQMTVGNFLIGKHEVTQAQWKTLMPNYSRYSGNDNLPVDYVSWGDVQDFINKLNAKTGKTYRLPTEAEWEYAARGGANSVGHEYSGGAEIDSLAWYKGNSGNKTHPVGTKAPNELGIHDMSGNLWEWTNDWYAPYAASDNPDPRGPQKGTNRVYRGGGWGNEAAHCRISKRSNAPPVLRGRFLGFRLAHDAE